MTRLTRISLIAILMFALTGSASAQRWDRGGWHRGGGDVGGAVIGGLIGGLIGGVFQPRPYYPPYQPYYQPQVDPYTYCSQRFRSWNPNTGYFLGYDGQYHRCP